MSRYLLTYFYPVAVQISLEWKMDTPIWNVILLILWSQMDFCTMEMILGSQNWQGYISNGFVYPLLKWDLCSDGVKIKLPLRKFLLHYFSIFSPLLNLRYYSFEACTTPRRNNCQNYGLANLGDGDFPYCDDGGTNNICQKLYKQLNKNRCPLPVYK